LPKPLALGVLIGIRMKLRRENLIDPQATPVAWGPERLPDGPRHEVRTITGDENDLTRSAEGSAGQIFGRNSALALDVCQNVVDPNPRVISNELLARDTFIPATSLNLVAAAWLQFEVHDWMSHGTNEPDDQFEVALESTDPWSHGRPMLVERTGNEAATTDGGVPSYRNTETHWWDASQVYGSTQVVEDMLRTDAEGTKIPGGKLRLTADDLLPFNPARFPLGHDVNLAGVSGNWWAGLAMMHTLFMREHNAICDRLAAVYPDMSDDDIYDHARLINAAQIAKIHTIEWTPALLTNPTLQTAMNVNWTGLLGPRVKKLLGRINLGEELDGITGSKTYDHGAPYAMTEEFVAVYRMHPLIPDDYSLRRAGNNAALEEKGFDELVGLNVDTVLAEVSMADLFYSFGTSNPGAIVLHNYPNHLRDLARPGQVPIDLATYDIVKCRERGVPRYNDFRRQFHLEPAKTFADFSRDPAIVAELERLYSHPDDVDTMVGLFAEAPPPGMAFSDTAFRVFSLMASRRLKSDRFYTYDYRPEVYTDEGMSWIDETSFSAVLLRHYPELGPALRGVTNAFQPWNVAGQPRAAVAHPVRSREWTRRRGFWNGLATFKYRHQKPSRIPVPTGAARPVQLVPFASRYPEIPIDGVLVGDHVPDDEAEKVKTAFSRLQGLLDHWYPPMEDGLPPVQERAEAALDEAYNQAHRSCFAAPDRSDDRGLGRLAVASPYASYLEAKGAGSFRWDFSLLSRFECHAGLVPLGAIVEFALDDTTGRLDAVNIETALGTAAPGSAAWDAAQRMAMCSITSYTSMIRHFNWLHLTCGGPLAAVTRDHLRAEHPVRRLLWPHVFGTQYSNDIVTPLQMGKGGDFETIFSLTHRGMCDLFEATTDLFDLALINPLTDAARRGVDGARLQAPAQENRSELFAVFTEHARRYLAVYYASDDAVANDQELGAWTAALGAALPHGVDAVMGANATFDGLVSLIATIIYFATVEHEITGSGLWDYQLWNDTSPVRIYEDGRRVPLDLYQRMVNANFNLNVRRVMLLDDFSTMALDAAGADAFKRFRSDLLTLQLELNRTPPQPWRMEPKRLKAKINA
jgi:hypothetical protein